MKFSRREMLLTGLGLLVTGCTENRSSLLTRPRTDWPDPIARPRTSGAVAVQPPATASVAARSASPSPSGLHALSRSQWTRRGPINGRVNPMNGINRITVHHEGWTPVWFTDYRTTAARLEQIRNIHVRDRGWGDIGYHYIIDRAGRVWEGRGIGYQGAHVSQNNEHNIGVMCLGNFEKQRPTDAQLNALVSTLRTLKNSYHVPVNRVYTHRELKPTACPGRNLQPRVVAISSNGYLA